jgi:dimethylhistidine N-methyltransferase
MPNHSFADDLRAGLCRPGQKVLPSKYLYDDVGSALFEAICVLPEYGLTRADTRLLSQHAEAWGARLPEKTLVVELGSGSSKKTRLILEPLGRRQPTQFFPIDISPAALVQCSRELGDVAGVEVVGLNSEYLPGLAAAAARRDAIAGAHLLVLFLGSTIGNFDRASGEEFLAAVRRVMVPGDLLLLSSDLVKREADLLHAYDDTAGVTAAFNKNVLVRINREMGGNFDVLRFAHVARWNQKDRRIEMHLRAQRDMDVTIEKAELRVHIAEGETIRTEESYKFELPEILGMAQRSGFSCEEQWVDREWPFSQSLLRAA